MSYIFEMVCWMKTKQEIEKNIHTAECLINNLKEQMNIYLNDDFDIDFLLAYSEKIKLLEVEIQALKWVLGE